MSPENLNSSFDKKSTDPRKVTAAILAVSLAFNLTPKADSSPAITPNYASATLEHTANVYLQDCEEVPESAIEASRDIYADTWISINSKENLVYKSMEEQFDYKQSVANELGLTIYDYASEYSELNRDLNSSFSPGQVSIETYWKSAEDFLKRYDVSLELSGSVSLEDKYTDFIPKHSDVTTPEILLKDNLETKRVLYNVIKGFGALPVEMVQATGTKRVILTDIPGNIIGFVSAGAIEFDTIFLDYKRTSGTTPAHEMFHLWDMLQCGPVNFQYDEQFNAINPSGENFYSDHDDFYSINNAQNTLLEQGLIRKKENASTQEEKAKIQSEIDSITKSIATMNDYGFTNTIEDKATIGESILSVFSRTGMESVQSPILQEKVNLLMARIYQDSPEIVEYFARTSFGSYQKENVLAD